MIGRKGKGERGNRRIGAGENRSSENDRKV